jgi:alkanesulfonate monooxygenase SsuD/methylene tetrahydromethanopterin reductase-like flavin-dependent oxidoreductase (luciferase family)
MDLDVSRLGYGITGSLDHGIVRELAPRVEAAGFRTLWINHGGDVDSLASMEVAASVTSRLRLATGVIPVDRVPVEYVIQGVRERDLPTDRVVIGIGASARPSPLTTVKDAASAITGELGVPVFVGALGPKMRRLAVRETDGVLLNWLTPGGVRQAMEDKKSDLEDLHGKDAEIALYIRCALGEEALPVLQREANRYAGIPAYAANFSRLGFEAIDSAVYAPDADGLKAGLRSFIGAVDEPVVRAITASDSLAEYVALVDAVSR